MNKKLLFSAALYLLSFVGFSQTLYDDYDNPANIVYSYFDGVSFNEDFDNPSTGGINSSAKCLRYGRNGGVEYDVIVIDPSGTNVIDDVSDYLTDTKQMSLKIFSPSIGITVQITLEDSNSAGPTNYPTGRHSVYLATTTKSLEWETLTFSFDNQPDNTVASTNVNRLVLLLNPGTFTSDVYLLDDIMGPEFVDPCASEAPDESIGDNFECQRNVSYDFTNGTLIKTDNPVAAGINTSDKVGKFTKFTPPTNDGAFGGSLDYPFTTDNYKTANIMLYDPSAPQDFLVIFQDGSSNNLIEKTFTTSSTTEWEEFKMDLSDISPSTSIEKYVLLLNPATDTEDSIYLDNFKFTNDEVESEDPPVSVNEVTNESLSIYPNPINDVLYLTSQQEISKIELYDITGALVFSKNNPSKNNKIDMHNYAKGAYLIKVTYSDNNAVVKKLTK